MKKLRPTLLPQKDKECSLGWTKGNKTFPASPAGFLRKKGRKAD
jgi:hypothetical protein